MKVAYIIGPFRAENSWEMEQNIRRAETFALEIWKLGYAVICPHTNTRFFQGAAPDNMWLDGDIEILGRCDIAFTVPKDLGGPNILSSSGSVKEMRIALILKIPVMVNRKYNITIDELEKALHDYATDYNEENEI